MFFYNGFVIGGEPKMPCKVTKVKPLSDRMMLISFNNGETRLFDSTILNGPAFLALEDSSIFMSPVIDHGIVTWKNGEIDCAPEFMYNNSYEYETLNAI